MSNKVLTARAWGWMDRDHTEMIANGASEFQRYPSDIPVVIVHGATESDILDGLSLLANSRVVCEIPKLPQDFSTEMGYTYDIYECGGFTYYTNINERPTFCPSCGRRVVIKESPND